MRKLTTILLVLMHVMVSGQTKLDTMAGYKYPMSDTSYHIVKWLDGESVKTDTAVMLSKAEKGIWGSVEALIITPDGKWGGSGIIRYVPDYQINRVILLRSKREIKKESIIKIIK